MAIIQDDYSGRHVKEEAPSDASRYSKPETFRTGSRYEDKQESQAQEAARVHQTYLQRLRSADPAVIILTVILAALAAAYIGAAIFFAGRYYPGTTIFGINCAGKNTAWVKAAISQKISGYSLILEERGSNEMITADEVGLIYEDKGGLETRLRKQYSALWPVMIFLRRDAQTDIGTVYDQDKTAEALGRLSCFQEENITAPEDAYIGETDDGYVVVPEVMGTLLDADRTRAVVMDALDEGLSHVSLEESGCYENPEIYQDDEALVKDADERNALLGADITYDFSDRKEEVNTRVIMSLISHYEHSGYQIDPDKVRQYVSDMADQYDTYGGTRTFHTTLGTDVTLYGGDYGWAIDQEATVQQLMDAIDNKQVISTEPIYAYTAMSRDRDDIGGTYVEICISSQEMWCYQDGVLMVDTPVVTGNVGLNRSTPSGGVWSVDDKQRNATLIGENYSQPVDYWIPFNGGVGIHDLQSRAYFGGNIYMYAGSHGCINTPLAAVAQIYDIVQIGTPVIVYD